MTKPYRLNLGYGSTAFGLAEVQPELFAGATKTPGARYDASTATGTTAKEGGLPTTALNSAGMVVMGFVIATYTGDDISAPGSPKSKGLTDHASGGSGIFCDVFCGSGSLVGPIVGAQVMTRSHGVTDTELWKPRAATVDITSGLLNLDESKGEPSDLSSCDGDCVLVTWRDNNFRYPIIIGQLPHPQATIVATMLDMPDYKWRRTIRGNLTGVEDGGKVTVSIKDQTGGTVLPDGSETPSPDPTLEVLAPTVTFTVNTLGAAIELLPFLSKLVVTGGGPDSIQLGDPVPVVAPLQKLMTASALKNLAGLLTEWAPVITAAAALFGIPLVKTPTTIAALSGGAAGDPLNELAALLTDALRGA